MNKETFDTMMGLVALVIAGMTAVCIALAVISFWFGYYNGKDDLRKEQDEQPEKETK